MFFLQYTYYSLIEELSPVKFAAIHFDIGAYPSCNNKIVKLGIPQLHKKNAHKNSSVTLCYTGHRLKERRRNVPILQVPNLQISQFHNVRKSSICSWGMLQFPTFPKYRLKSA